MYQSGVHRLVLPRPVPSGNSASPLLSGIGWYEPSSAGRAPTRFGSRRSRVRIPPPRHEHPGHMALIRLHGCTKTGVGAAWVQLTPVSDPCRTAVRQRLWAFTEIRRSQPGTSTTTLVLVPRAAAVRAEVAVGSGAGRRLGLAPSSRCSAASLPTQVQHEARRLANEEGCRPRRPRHPAPPSTRCRRPRRNPSTGMTLRVRG